MSNLPVPAPARTCGTCVYWTPGWLGPDRWGFCTWRESKNRPRQPRMNWGSHYTLSVGGHVLETRADSGCMQWAAQAERAKRP